MKIQHRYFNLLTLIGLISLGCSVNLSAEPLRQITQENITWTFDGEYECGQFANGDWWVVGPVTLTNISPAFDGSSNGWQSNPTILTQQGFDSRVGGFTSTLVPSLPYTAMAGESIVKSVSVPPGSCRPCLQTAAVLTVLSSVPPDNGQTVFRPPYFGTEKPFYRTQDLRTDLLPALEPVSSAPSLSWMENRFKRVQLDFINSWWGRLMHPEDNLPDYGSSIAINNADGALRLMLNDPLADKFSALVYYVQMGIDHHHVLKTGVNWPTYGGGGGHMLGRKMPIAFAAEVLDNQDMRDTLANADNFVEDIQTYPSPVTNRALFGIPGPENVYWNKIMDDRNSGARDIRDPYGMIDGGIRSGHSYQFCCTSIPYKGNALAAMLMPGARQTLNSEVLMQYVDRWVSVGAWTQPDHCAPVRGTCLNNPILSCTSANEVSVCGSVGSCIGNTGELGVLFGPDPSNAGQCIEDTDPSDGIGRFPLLQGINANQGSYGSKFVADMWAKYRSVASQENLKPFVDAGSDQSITFPENTVHLVGVASDDQLPSPPAQLSFLWSQISGPGVVTFTDPTNNVCEATFPKAGKYTIRLTAQDGLLSSNDDLFVTVIDPAHNQESSLVPCNNVNDTGAFTEPDICFDMPNDGQVELKIYSRFGQLVRTLMDEHRAAGSYTLTWDGKNDDGQNVSSGVYTYVLKAGGKKLTSKLPIVR